MPAVTVTVTSRDFRCDFIGGEHDHGGCVVSGTYKSDAEAGMAGWGIVTLNGREYALCRAHKIEIENQLRYRTRSPSH